MPAPDEPDAAARRARAILTLVPPALAAARTGVWDWDIGEDRVIYCSVVARLFGLPGTASWTGLPIARLVERLHPEHRPVFAARMERARARDWLIDVSYRTVPAEGVEYDVLVRGRYDLDLDGAPVHARGLVIDMTADGPLDQAVEHAIAARRAVDAMGAAGRPQRPLSRAQSSPPRRDRPETARGDAAEH